jgi:hypothetical protein
MTATFPPHLYFALLGALREFRVPGCFVDMVQDTGVATFTGRPQAVSASKAQFAQVVRRLQQEDLAKARAHAEEGTTPGPVYEPVHGAVSLPTSGHSPKVAASYSWNMADPNEPYAIPGHLRTFSKPKTPLSLAADGEGAHDPLSWDTARGMATALEPIVVACCALDPTFSVSAYQVVTDRNNLRKIFRWACGDRNRWRIDLEKVAPDTIAMLRFDLSEEGQTELLQRKRSGYRFEDLCCAGDDGRASASADSYRAVLEFDMAGTRFLMRCEIDAMAPQESGELLESQLAQLSLAARPLKLAGSELVFQRSAWPKAPEFVELTSMIDQRFEHPRDLKEMKDKWFQAYIAGVHTTVFGLKPARDKMVVESTVELSPSELLQWFKMDVSRELTETMNVVGFVRECLADKPVGAVHSLYFEPTDPQPGIRLRQRRGTVDRAFPSYIYEQQSYAVIDAATHQA